MKKLLMFFLAINAAVLIAAAAAESQSIEDLIDSSSEDVQKTSPGLNDPSAKSDASSETLYAIQTGTFFNEADANAHIIKLQAAGFAPYIFQSVNSRGETIYASRIGRFESHAAAAAELTRMENSIDTPLLITYFDSLTPAVSNLPKAEPPKPRNVAPESQPETAPASSADSPADAPAYSAAPMGLEALQEKLEKMEMEIQKLRDEADIRSQLEITEEEEQAEEEDILEAAGREYTLTREGNIKFSYGISYGYSGYDAIRESTRIEDVADHTIVNSFSISYGLKDNFTVGTSIPFIYAYHKVGTVDSLDVTDFGDMRLSWQLQPFKSKKNLPTIILNGDIGIPVGRNPYEIQVGEELSTASGIYDATVGVSVSQVSDPVVVFSSLSMVYPFAVQSINQKRDEGVLDEVDPGMSFGAAVGLGYALSYKLNVNLSFSYSYAFETTYKYENAPDFDGGNSTGASIRVGTGYKLSQNQNLNFTVGIPLTDSRSFSISMSTPIDFEL